MRTVRFTLLTLVTVFALFLALQILSADAPDERIANGSFEQGFQPDGVALGWSRFDNGGQAFYSWHDDRWAPVVSDGTHSQLIEVNTITLAASEPDRYAGIFQPVAVVPGATYQLSLHGMLRARADDPDLTNYSYRVQWGFTDGSTNWQDVANWIEISWDKVYPRLDPGEMQSYSTSFVAPSNNIVLFFRVWKKWGTAQRELDVNLDAIRLTGAQPADNAAPTVSITPPNFPVVGKTYPIGVFASNDVGVTRVQVSDNGVSVGETVFTTGPLSLSTEYQWTPTTPGVHTLHATAQDAAGKITSASTTVTVGNSLEFLKNGDFEGGFGADGVALNWFKFDNGGSQTLFSWHDDTWTPVVLDGQHSQLVEVNTTPFAASEFDRYSGICQVVDELTPGSTLQLTLNGMLRALPGDRFAQEHGYAVQWGYDPAGGTDWTVINNWVELPWDTAYDRLSPGKYLTYDADLTAPASKMTLCVRAWKKWPSGGNELNVNLDGLSLKGFK